MADPTEGIRARARRALTVLISEPPAPAPMPSAARADANAVGATRSGASMVNDLSGLGLAKDSGATARPYLSRDFLSLQELHAMTRGGPYRAICSVFGDDATREGQDIMGGSREFASVMDRWDELGVQESMRIAQYLGRAFAEARLLVVVDDGLKDWSKPLVPENVRKVHSIVVLDPHEFTPIEWDSDLRSPTCGQPLFYSVTPNVAGDITELGSGQRVHTSRLLRFYGDYLHRSVAYASGGVMWPGAADAVGQVIWDGVRDVGQLGAAGARAAQEISLLVMKIKDARAKSAGDGSSRFLGWLSQMMQQKSIAQAVFVGDDEHVERLPVQLSGFRDLSEHAMNMLQLYTRIPAPRLFGQAPSGLNTDGDSWQASWHADISTFQTSRMLGPMRFIYRCLIAEQGMEQPDRLAVKYRPLGKSSPLERAQIRQVTTMADIAAVDAGHISLDRVRTARYGAEGWRDEVPPLDEEEQAAAEEAELARLLAAAETDAAAREQEREDAIDEASTLVMVPLPESLRALWQGVRAAVEEIVGEMPEQEDPHITVLYAGKLTSEQAAEFARRTIDVSRRCVPAQVSVDSLTLFEPSEGSDGQTPVVLTVWCHVFYQLHQAILRDCADLIQARQFPEFHAHLTVGYAPAGLTDEQRAVVLALEVPEIEWSVGSVEVRRGGDVLTIAPLAGRHDGEDADFRSRQFTIPASAKGNAQKVLAWKEEHGSAVKGMTSTGWARARQLAKGGKISGQDLVEVAAWFARHGAQSATKAVAQEHKDEPWKDAGWVSWLGWGGDTMKTFATETVERARKAD